MIWATMVTLAERMSHDELVRLGAWLPEKLQAAAHAGSPACEPFGADEAGARHLGAGGGRDGAGTAAAAA
jgi:hypothetical protein